MTDRSDRPEKDSSPRVRGVDRPGRRNSTEVEMTTKEQREKWRREAVDMAGAPPVFAGIAIEKMAAHIDALEAQLAAWKKAVEGLTPNGSEFVDDPEACAAHIRQARSDMLTAMKRFKSQRDAARDVALGEAQAACKALEDEWAEKRDTERVFRGPHWDYFNCKAGAAYICRDRIRALRTPAGEPPAEGQGGEG